MIWTEWINNPKGGHLFKNWSKLQSGTFLGVLLVSEKSFNTRWTSDTDQKGALEIIFTRPGLKGEPLLFLSGRNGHLRRSHHQNPTLRCSFSFPSHWQNPFFLLRQLTFLHENSGVWSPHQLNFHFIIHSNKMVELCDIIQQTWTRFGLIGTSSARSS